MTHPTPEDFLTDQHAGEDEPECIDPLVSIADSLNRLVEAMAWSGTDEAAAADQNYTQLEKAYEELDQRYDDLLELVDAIEALIKPSTSKLANGVRTAIAAWRGPDEPVAIENTAQMGPQQPAPDADVEQWALYAEALGFEVHDSMNRSQIRTLLGIEQPTSA